MYKNIQGKIDSPPINDKNSKSMPKYDNVVFNK